MRLGFIEPMKPTLAAAPPAGAGWIHEIKHDGFRTELVLDEAGVRAFTSNGHDWSDRYRHVLQAARDLRCTSAILDGEMVVQDELGRSDFRAFQAALGRRPERLVFMAFDLLSLDGEDLRPLPLLDRKSRLNRIIGGNDPHRPIHYVDHVEGSGEALFQAAEQISLEGIISKRRTSAYRSGKTRAWLKIKCFVEGEFVVVGTSKGELAPVALLAAETDEGLTYVGEAMVTLAAAEKERFWRENERLKTATPAVPSKKPKDTSWLRPEMKVRVKHLAGEEPLRHATVRSVSAWPDEPRP